LFLTKLNLLFEFLDKGGKEVCMFLNEILKEKVESYCVNFENNSKLFNLARERRITFDVVQKYFSGLEHLFFTNCETLKLVLDSPHLNKDLRTFLAKKLKEESGHNLWAQNDMLELVELGKVQNLNAKEDKNVLELSNFIRNFAETDPVYFLIYIFIAEYKVGILGPKWMCFLETNLGLKSENATSLSKHIELDEDHSAEALDVIKKMETSLKAEDLFKYVNLLFEKYDSFFEGLVENELS